MMFNQHPLYRPIGKYWPLRLAYSQAWLDVGGGVEDAVLVAGVGRSGTTWLSEVISKSTLSREIFEPFIANDDGRFVFSIKNGDQNQISHMPNNSIYIPPHLKQSFQHFDAIEAILKGRVRSWWTEQGMTPGLYKKRVIKDIRTNLMLGWLSECWPNLKIIYVVRPPVQTIASMLERSASGWGFDCELKQFLKQEELAETYLKPFIGDLEKNYDLDMRLLLRWCVENHVAISQLQGKPNVMIVQYRDLIKNPLLWKDIFKFINWPYRQHIFVKQIDQQSKTSAASFTRQGEQSINVVNALKQNNQLTHLVTKFGLDQYL